MERFGKISLYDREVESVPGEPAEYYFEHQYWLEIELTEDYLYGGADGEEFLGTEPMIYITANHTKIYRRSGKALSENLTSDEFVQIVVPDPIKLRLNIVVLKLSEYTNQYPWLEKLFELMQ